jgi:capsular polysaccharide transport system permease protein
MTAVREYGHERGYWEAQKVQLRIISALMVREAMTRFGHENLGFFWIMGEPLVLTVGVMILWSVTGVGHGHGIPVLAFALTGYTLLTLWRHIVFRSVHAMRANIGMLFHRNVRFLDILVARAILETLGGLAAFFIAYLPLNLLGYIDDIYDPLTFISAWFLMAWWAFAFGLVLAGLSEISEAIEKFIGPIMYLSLPATGSFYMVSWLPPSAQKLAEYSPLVTVFEMFRSGLFGPKLETHWDAGYIVLCCLIVTAFGLPIVKKAQEHVRME